MLRSLWQDEHGGVISLEIVLVGSILGIGLVTGLASVRDAVITELADIAGSVGSMDQGMSIMGANSASSSTASMSFQDTHDTGDTMTAQANSQCLVICGSQRAAVLEGNEIGG